jgi:serine protease Do
VLLLGLSLGAESLAGLGCSDRGGGGKASASVAAPAPAPLPSVLAAPSAPRPVLVDSGGRPMSFAPLVERSDSSVATVKAIIRGRGTWAEGLGTAFVYDPDGYLLTNHHVVESASNILVGFRDGKEYEARVVGADRRTDIAVLKVEAKGLATLPLGDSDEILVGDWVVAIGNPFGLSHTVSAGILSAKGRTNDDVKGLDPSGYFDFLQTDASINPGNSGGPLLNLKGEVVGINAAIRQNANSIGFAIPINMVKQLLPTLLRDGRIRRSALGLVVAEVPADEASRLKLKDRKGAWVKQVAGGGPADKAGLAVDDVILTFDAKPVNGPNELRWYASIFGVGQVATIRVSRAGREFELRATLGELPEDPNDH